MNKRVFAMMTAACVLAAVAAYLLLTNPTESPRVRAGGGNPGEPANSTRSPGARSDAPIRAADAKMQTLEKVDQRVAHLEWIAQQEWASSDMPVLRRTIVSDPSETVQLKAIEVALALASKEPSHATAAVVRTSLASTMGNTRARGLKAAREMPDPALVPDLVALVDERDPYASMALNALAHTDSVEAHAKVFELARDATADSKLRERAVALLAVTKEGEARPLLVELANGENQSLARIAQEVLRVLNEG